MPPASALAPASSKPHRMLLARAGAAMRELGPYAGLWWVLALQRADRKRLGADHHAVPASTQPAAHAGAVPPRHWAMVRGSRSPLLASPQRRSEPLQLRVRGWPGER